MRVVGLTGGIATGKSTVSEEFERFGLPVIDADKIARDAVKKGTLGYNRVVAAFGRQILLPDGEIDRLKLGEIVFRDPAKRQKLNRTIQPYIGISLLRSLACYWLQGARVVVLDAPLLFETKIDRFTKPIIVVSCNRETQKERLIVRNGFSGEQAEARIDSQLPLELKTARADIVIDNVGTIDELRSHAQKVYDKLNRPLSWWEMLFSREGFVALLGACLAFFLIIW